MYTAKVYIPITAETRVTMPAVLQMYLHFKTANIHQDYDWISMNVHRLDVLSHSCMYWIRTSAVVSTSSVQLALQHNIQLYYLRLEHLQCIWLKRLKNAWKIQQEVESCFVKKKSLQKISCLFLKHSQAIFLSSFSWTFWKKNVRKFHQNIIKINFCKLHISENIDLRSMIYTPKEC